MAKHSSTDVLIPRDVYERMCNVMIELTNRGASQEAMVKRIAKAGEVKDVVSYIDRMRKYMKRHAPARHVHHVDALPQPSSRQSKRKQAPRKPVSRRSVATGTVTGATQQASSQPVAAVAPASTSEGVSA